MRISSEADNKISKEAPWPVLQKINQQVSIQKSQISSWQKLRLSLRQENKNNYRLEMELLCLFSLFLNHCTENPATKYIPAQCCPKFSGLGHFVLMTFGAFDCKSQGPPGCTGLTWTRRLWLPRQAAVQMEGSRQEGTSCQWREKTASLNGCPDTDQG